MQIVNQICHELLFLERYMAEDIHIEQSKKVFATSRAINVKFNPDGCVLGFQIPEDGVTSNGAETKAVEEL